MASESDTGNWREGGEDQRPACSRQIDVPAGTCCLDVCPDRKNIDALRDRIVSELTAAGYSDTACFAIRLAYEEAVSNAREHGHAGKTEIPIRVEYHVTPARFFLRVTDHGPGFDPDAVSDPTLPENLLNPTGRGLLLMRAYMSQIVFNEQGNAVTCVFNNPRTPLSGERSA